MTASRFARRTFSALAAGILAGAALLAVGPSPASAAPTQSLIRAAHFSPTTPGVDVYLTPFSGGATKTAWLSNVTYGTVSGYESLASGTYTVAMRLAGAPASSAPALSWVLDAKPGAAYTIAGVGAGASVRGVVISDDPAVPQAGSGLVRVIQAASRAPVLSVRGVGGPVIAAGAQFASVTSYTNVAAGTLRVQAASTSDPSISADTTVTVKSGQVSTILLLDDPTRGITARVLVDAAADAAVPVGSINAGGGGTATVTTGSSSVGKWLSLAGITGALLVGAAAFIIVSARRSRRPVVAAGRHAAS
jgi:hypothetical protein